MVASTGLISREASGSKPAKRRPVLVIQSGPFNASRLSTTVHGSGDHLEHQARDDAWQRLYPRGSHGPAKGLVVNVTALVTLDKTDLGTHRSHLPDSLMRRRQPRTPQAAFSL